MSYRSDALATCPELQTGLDAFFANGGVSQGVVVEPMPLLQHVVNNTGGIQQAVHPEQNKAFKVDLLYTQMILEDEVVPASGDSCTATTQRGNCSKSYEIDTNDRLHIEELITEEELRFNCKNNNQYFMERINVLINAMDRKVATKNANETALLLGGWGSDVQDTSGNFLEVATQKNGQTDELAPYTLEDVQTALNISGFNSQTLVVGGQDIYKYMRKMANGCCSNQGLDLGAMFDEFGFANAWDKRVVKAAGGNEFSWAIQAGAIQLLQWTNGSWMDSDNGMLDDSKNYVSMVLRSPQTGVRYDVTIKDDCKKLAINIYATVKTISMPDDMFPTGSDYELVKFAAPIQVVNV